MPEVNGHTQAPREPEEPPSAPEVGSLLRDTKRECPAVVMARWGGQLYLRDPKGGREWEQQLKNTRPLTAREELSVRLEIQNAQSAQRARLA